MSVENLPTNLDECIFLLKKELPSEIEEEIIKAENMIHYHHSLGREIRNNFGLWDGNGLLIWAFITRMI